ncbi:MAG: FAD-binding protein [Acidimicrobiia bacterium]|nr:FAD-binding protein [Acidimicrobiia bacterium]
MANAWWKQVPLKAALRSPSPPGVWIPWGDAMIQVNKYGRRVVNEKMAYSDRSRIHAAYDPNRREYPNLLMFMLYDDNVASSPSRHVMRHPIPMPGKDADYVIKGDTWDDLATNIDAALVEMADDIAGLRLDPSFSTNLAATIARFDDFAETGRDLDFGRGEAAIARAWSGPKRPGSPNPSIAPFAAEGPYYCIIVCAATLDTNGGPVINPRAQVIDVQGEPIPGLYGAGNCIASPAGQGVLGSRGDHRTRHHFRSPRRSRRRRRVDQVVRNLKSGGDRHNGPDRAALRLPQPGRRPGDHSRPVRRMPGHVRVGVTGSASTTRCCPSTTEQTTASSRHR